MCTRKNIFDFFVKSLESQSSMDFLCHALCTNPYGKSQCMQFYFFQIQILFLEKKGNAKWGCVQSACLAFSFFSLLGCQSPARLQKDFFLFSFANWSQAEKGIAVLFAREYSRRSMTPFLCSLPDTPCMRANVILLSHTIAKRWQ